jgi:hypothetical protein
VGHNRRLIVVSREVVEGDVIECVIDVVAGSVEVSAGSVVVLAVVVDVLVVVVDVLVVAVDVLVVVVDVLAEVVVAVVAVVVSAVVAHVGDDSERTRALLTNLKLLNMDRRGERRVAEGFSQSLVEVDIVEPVLVVDADVSAEVLAVVEAVTVVDVVEVVEVVVEGIECGFLTLVIQVTSPEDDASADSVVQSPALSLAKISSVVQPSALRCRKMSSVFCPSSPTWSRVKKSSPFFGLCIVKKEKKISINIVNTNIR